jgi:hypothetical protein
MGETTTLDIERPFPIHKGRRVQSDPEIEDLGRIEDYEVEEYDGLKVEDVTDEYSFEHWDSGNRLLETENGELLIVHHSAVDTGAWSFMPSKDDAS